MATPKPIARLARSSLLLALVAGISAVPSFANATPPGKAPWRYGTGFDPTHDTATGLQTQIDRDRQQELCERDVQSGRARAGECPLPTRGGESASNVASSPSRQRQHVLPHPAGTARGGGPRGRGGGPRPCSGADRSSNGNCVAPDLTPASPQNQWDRDPRQPPMLQQNAPGPSVLPGETPGAATGSGDTSSNNRGTDVNGTGAGDNVVR